MNHGLYSLPDPIGVIFNLHLDGFYILFLSETNGICTPLLNTHFLKKNIYHELYQCDPKIIPHMESAPYSYIYTHKFIFLKTQINK